MKSIKSILCLVGLAVFFSSCNDTASEASSHAYFGGYIVNPVNNYLLFSKDTIVRDSIFFDEGDNFGTRLPEVEEGFYSFQHGHEHQMIHLSPGDSLLTWVNTLEFDESLYFSGRGAEKNNFLIQLYLWNEQNTNLILNYYENNPVQFEAKTDSIREQRVNSLSKLSRIADIPDNFLKAAEKIIEYEQYDLRERYTYMINKYFREYANEFPESFYDYREEVDFGEEKLQSNPAYLRFLENYLINLSMKECDGAPENNDCYNTNDHDNIVKRIELIDSLSSNSIIKRHFFSRLGALGMVMGSNREELVGILEILKQKGIPQKEYIELVTLGNIQLAFIPGTNVNSIPLITAEQDSITADEAIRKRSIFYLWSVHAPNHHKQQHEIIADLRRKYESIDFIGINVDPGESGNWRNALQKYEYPVEREYQLAEVEIEGQPIDSNIYRYYLDKLLFIDANGRVVIGDAYLDSPDFESKILEFLNL